MINIQSSYAHAEAVRRTKVTYEQRSALFGLIKWWREVKIEVAGGLELHAVMSEKPSRVLIHANNKTYEYKTLP